MHLDIRQLPGFSPLVRDYAHAFSTLAPFYAWDPHDPDSPHRQAETCVARTYRRSGLQAALLARHAAWGIPAIVRQRIAELAQPGTLAVVTGQQTGLFGGPLYTLYKALTAVALAERFRHTLGRPVVPLFWMASEDHDVAEADHIHLLDRSGTLVTLRHTQWENPEGFMPSVLRLGTAVQETLRQAWDLLPATDLLSPLREALTRAYTPERTLADAFACWMVHLLGDTGLVLVDAADPALKRLAAGVFRQELETAPRSSQAILQVSRSLGHLGYPAQIEARPDGVNCFLLDEGRRALTRDGSAFRVRDRAAPMPAAELLRLAEAQPERLSPNVALRPIVQDSLFPTLAYVAGPGELSYFAQLRPVYEAFQVPMPLVLPRATLTLVEPRIAQFMERFHLELPDLVLEPEQLASRVLRAQFPPDAETTLTRARADLEEIFRGVGAVVSGIDPTLQATVGQTAGHLKGHLDQLERKVVQALKRREGETRQQVQRVREALMPGGKPQERGLPALPYLAKYGPAFLAVLGRHIDGPGWDHQLVSLRGA